MTTAKRSIAASMMEFLSSKLLLVLIAVALIAASIYLWKTQETSDLAQLAVEANSKARSYSSETENRYDRIYGALTRLASGGAPRSAAAIAEWKKDAAFYVDTFNGIKAVAWVDDAFRIREMIPLPESAAHIGQLANAIELAPLEVNLWLPTYDDLDFRGFILGTIGLEDLIAPILDEIGDGYMLQLADENGAVYTSKNWQPPQGGETTTRNITLKNTAVLKLVLAPTRNLVTASTDNAKNTLWFALLLSLITVIAAAFAQNYLGKARSSELHYRSLFQSSQDAIFVTNAAGAFQDANPAATTLVGFSLAELQQMTAPDLLAEQATPHQGDPPLNWRAGASAETHFRHKQGHEIPVELGIAAVGNTNRPQFVVAIARDITERKRAEAELRRYHDHLETIVAERTRALQEANAELESFSFSVSHDLRAPLRHIDGFIQLLNQRLGESIDPTAQHYLRNVIDASQRMGQLIDDLLRFSRTSRTEMAFSSVDPMAVIEQVQDDLQAAMVGRDIIWEIGCLPRVMADPSLLRVVWTNLIANAIKFTGKQETATIAIDIDPTPRTDGKGVFFIRDSGVGFDPAYAHNLFGVFQRLHREDEFDGTGIGLATVRRIIHRHDGEIWAEAAEGKGATFFFTLRLAGE